MHRLLFLFLISLLSCSLNNTIKPHEKVCLWLKVSLYAGQFFDDPQYRLVSYNPFISFQKQEISGQKVRLSKPDKIIPAGTLVELIDISYPNTQTNFIRPIYSHRNNVWLFLRIGRERGLVNIFFDKIHIMILPSYINSEEKVNEFIRKIFSKEDPNAWLLTQRKYIQEAIFLKNPLIGMNQQHIEAALGIPKSREKKIDDLGLNQELWEYDHYLILFTNGEVTKITKLREI